MCAYVRAVVSYMHVICVAAMRIATYYSIRIVCITISYVCTLYVRYVCVYKVTTRTRARARAHCDDACCART